MLDHVLCVGVSDNDDDDDDNDPYETPSCKFR